MRQRIICFLIIISFFTMFSERVYGADTEVETLIGTKINQMNLEEIDYYLEGAGTDFSFSQIIQEIMSGEFDFSPKEIFSKVLKTMFSEVYNQVDNIKKIMFIAILCGFLKTLEDSFESKDVAELGFFVSYILLIYIVMTLFYEGCALVLNMTNTLIVLLKQMIPLFLTVMVFSGTGAEGAVMGPFIMGTAGVLSVVIQNGIVPAIGFTAVLELANNISGKGLLTQLSSLFKKFIEYAIKGCAFVFMAVTALQKTGVSAVTGIAGKTARGAISAVPIVGDIMNGAIDTAAGFTGLLKNSFTVATVILVCGVVMLPVIKLAVMYLVYKMTAALIEPISEPRLIKALSSAGDFTAMLIGCLFVVSSMFVFSTIILLGVT